MNKTVNEYRDLRYKSALIMGWKEISDQEAEDLIYSKPHKFKNVFSVENKPEIGVWNLIYAKGSVPYSWKPDIEIEDARFLVKTFCKDNKAKFKFVENLFKLIKLQNSPVTISDDYYQLIMAEPLQLTTAVVLANES